MTTMLVFAFGVVLCAFGMLAMADARRWYRKAQALFDEVCAISDAIEANREAQIQMAVEALADRIQDASGIRP